MSEYLKLDANIGDICYEYNSNETYNKLKRRKNDSVRESKKETLRGSHYADIMLNNLTFILNNSFSKDLIGIICGSDCV